MISTGLPSSWTSKSSLLQAGDRLALLVGHEDVEVDDADLDRLAEALRGGRLPGRREGRDGQEQAERQPGDPPGATAKTSRHELLLYHE